MQQPAHQSYPLTRSIILRVILSVVEWMTAIRQLAEERRRDWCGVSFCGQLSLVIGQKLKILCTRITR